MAAEIETIISSWEQEYGHAHAQAAHLLCDRHPEDDVAFTFIAEDLSTSELTYGQLADESRRLAAGLQARGVGEGDRVPVLMTKRRELIISLMALWRLGAVHVPLFTAFASGAIELRVNESAARLAITEASQAQKFSSLQEQLELIVIEEDYADLTTGHGSHTEAVAVGGEGPIVQLYTSGTTGKPKGVVVPLRALGCFVSYQHFGIDLRAEDVFWNAADPGWAYGLYFGVLAPLATGRRSIMFNAAFSPESTVEVIQRLGVTNFAGAPTVYRALRKSGVVQGLRLRRACSAGEPLTPDVVEWAQEALGVEVRDHYGQTELAMAVCNHAHPDLREEIRTGSMGKPLPGYAVDIIDGQIAIDAANSPLMWFTGYQGAPEKTAERFTADGRWYLTGDAGYTDEDGFFYFTARDDDLILASGYRIGPFDVESVLITHPEVADVAVVGKADPEGIRGEVVHAYVVPAAGQGSQKLADELKEMVRSEYSRHAAPRQISFVTELPKTPSGKVQRYILRQQH